MEPLRVSRDGRTVFQQLMHLFWLLQAVHSCLPTHPCLHTVLPTHVQAVLVVRRTQVTYPRPHILYVYGDELFLAIRTRPSRGLKQFGQDAQGAKTV